MKKVICAFLLAASVAAMALASGENSPRNTLHCNGLTVKDPENVSRVYAIADGNISGVWVSHPAVKSQVSIYTSRGQGSVIGFHGDTAKDTAMPFAISMQGGKVFFQVRDESGKFHHIPATDLLKLASISK